VEGMNEDKQQIDPICQLQVIPEASDGLTLKDRLRLSFLRLIRACERRLGYAPHLLPPQQDENQSAVIKTLIEARLHRGFYEGDWVEVKSMAEIKITLDNQLRCKGLEFMPGMSQFCGNRLRIRKTVRAIFDERAWRMLKIKKTYLLEDAICDGRGMYEKEGCDRCCYYFWKENWLKRLPESETLKV
jgi:hypothetical protein